MLVGRDESGGGHLRFVTYQAVTGLTPPASLSLPLWWILSRKPSGKINTSVLKSPLYQVFVCDDVRCS